MDKLLEWAVENQKLILLLATLTVPLLGRYLYHRLGKPRIEIFIELIKVTDSKHFPFQLHLKVSNSSSVGVWLEEIEMIVEDYLTEEIGTLNKNPVKENLAPYNTQFIECQQQLVAAHPGDSDPSRILSGNVKVRLRYRAHSRWKRTEWGRYFLEFNTCDVNKIRAESTSENFWHRVRTKTHFWKDG